MKNNKKLCLVGLVSSLILDVSFYYLAYRAYVDYKEAIFVMCFGISMGFTFLYFKDLYRLRKWK